MSLVQWVGCMLATTSRAASRATSPGRRCWVCSTRWRTAGGHARRRASAYAVSTRWLASSPMACVAVPRPARVARTTTSTRSGTLMTSIPRPPPGNGSPMWHVCDPRAPSLNTLTGPVDSQSSPSPVRRPSSIAWSRAVSGTDLWTRIVSSPAARKVSYAAVASSPSKQWTPVRPTASRRCWATRSWSVRSPEWSVMRCSPAMVADSRRIPVALPTASRSMVPPGGSGVWSSIESCCRAGELTQCVWPSMDGRMAGRSGQTRSRTSRSGSPSGQSLASQRPPKSHRPGSSPATNRAISASASRWVVQSRRSTVVRSRA